MRCFLARQKCWRLRLFIQSQPLLVFIIFFLSVTIVVFQYSDDKLIQLQINELESFIDTAVTDNSVQPEEPYEMPDNYVGPLKAQKMWEDSQNEKNEDVSKKRATYGPMKINNSQYCVHIYQGAIPPKDGTQMVTFAACLGEDRLKYKFENGKWLHPSSGKCIDVRNENELQIQTHCSANFDYNVETGELNHRESGLCVFAKPRREDFLRLSDNCSCKWKIIVEPRNTRKRLKKPKFVEEHVKKVAISILITKDPGKHSGFLDSAGALVMSIREAKLSYDYDLIAMVAKEVQESRAALTKLGFEIIEKELPIQASEIQNSRLAQDIVIDGCCGINELLKLHAWTMMEYDRVLQIDADILFHKNFDELFEYDATLVWTHGALGGTEPLNGGFLVIKPNLEDYKEMVEIIREGDYRPGRGWRGVCCEVYGGRTIQGILPYFYLHHKRARNLEIERCQYNNMVEVDRCKTWDFDRVTSNHFTVCEKPFKCAPSIEQRSVLCTNLTNRWWDMTHKLEEELGLEKRRHCQGGNYKSIEFENAKHNLKWHR